MRIRASALLTALLLLPVAAARAQETPTEEPSVGSVDFGGQFTTTDGDEARYERYRDLRSSGLVDAFKYNRTKDAWQFNMTADHVGHRDQRYAAQFWKYDRAKVSFMWDQIPLFYSTGDRDAFGLLSATPYSGVGTGEYRLDDAVQADLQAVCPTPPCPPDTQAQRQTLLFQLTNQQAQSLDVRHRRDTALIDAAVMLMKNTNLLLHFQSVQKDGTQPWNASFGFSAAVELPGPVDHRTTDVGAAVEYANEKGMVKIGWDGSWFTNHVGTLVWDNPLRITDFTYSSAYSPGDGTSQGRMDLWPDSTMNMVSGTATYKLPRRSKVYGNLGFSHWNQNDQLLPFTINTAIPTIPLERSTAEAEVNVTSALIGFTSRPTDKTWINLRYKLYDYDNNTPEFPVHEYVRFDQVIEEFLAGTGAEGFSYKRQYFDADFSYSFMPFTAVRVGYSRETDRRSFRQFERTTDNIFKLGLDTTGWQYGLLRVQYDYARRTGTGLDEEVFDEESEGFAAPRQFDISDRNRKRFSLIGSATPTDIISIDAQVGVFRDERPDTQFGLLTNDGDFYSIGVNVTPNPKLGLGVTYGKDKYTTLQKSRQANPGPQQQDPRRDWTTDYEDDVDSVYAYVDLMKALPKTDIRYTFDWMDGVNDITYGLAPDQTIFTTVPLIQLPNASHTIKRSTVDVMYRVNRRIGAGFAWLYEDYAVRDWAWNDCGTPCVAGTPTVPASPALTADGLALNPPGQASTSAQFLSLTRYLYRPYTGNTVLLRLRYFF
jgi:MtrB/PioB family decaheme-associated outer membrane protein